MKKKYENEYSQFIVKEKTRHKENILGSKNTEQYFGYNRKHILKKVKL